MPGQIEKEKLLPVPYHANTGHTISGSNYGMASTEENAAVRTPSNGRNSKFKPILYVSLSIIVLLVLTVITVLIIATVYSQSLDDYSNSPRLACANDTVVVGRVSSFFYSSVTITECLKRNDYTHVGDIFIEESKDLVTHSEFLEYHSIHYDQPDPSQITGLEDYIYLLEGSEVEYTICLSSDTSNEEKGYLYIFDDRSVYLKYASDPNDSKNLKQSAFSSVLEIGANNQSICTTVSYSVNNPTYLFIACRTPGSIQYNYTLSTHKVYYNHNDFNKLLCQTGGVSCNIKLPGGFFHPQDLEILAYIEVPVSADPFTTHLCMTPHVSSTFAVLILSSLFVACVLFLFVMCLTVFGVRAKKRRSRKIRALYGNYNTVIN